MFGMALIILPNLQLQAAQYLKESIKYTTDEEDLATLYFELGNQQKDLTQYKQALQVRAPF